MNYSYIFFNAVRTSFVSALVIALLGMFSYLAFEPTISRSASDTSQFLVNQTIGDAISFTVSAGNVTMNGTIDGLVGGFATGTTYAVVRTNAPAGYSMTLGFSSTTAMSGIANGDYINNYSLTATTVPDYTWQDNGSGQAAEFGYTVNASSTTDIAQYFLDNGTNCNISSGAGGSYNANRCWMSPTTTAAADTIINRTTSAPGGATTTIQFKVAVPNTPSPSLQSDTYRATATLTATTNP